MKKITVLTAMLLALSMNAKAATVERNSAGNLTINVFANIIESFRVSIENGDIVLAGPAPAADGLLDLNGGLAGFDGLKSVAASACKDDADVAPTYLDSAKTHCSVILGAAPANASNSKLHFDVDLAVKVELSGPGNIDLAASLGGTQGDEAFAASSVMFQGTTPSASVLGLIDQDTKTLKFVGDAPFAGGPSYDDTIVVAVTKN